MAISEATGTTKLLWVNPEKRPWRELTAILSFMGNENTQGFDCQQIRWSLERAKSLDKFAVWSGGLKVRSNAGDQSVKQNDDFVESEVHLDSSFLGANWFAKLSEEMGRLEQLSKIIYGTTMAFCKSQKLDGKDHSAQAAHLFWQFCERRFQDLVSACEDKSGKETKKLRRVFGSFAEKAYNAYCPRETARQLDVWAEHRPNLSQYLA